MSYTPSLWRSSSSWTEDTASSSSNDAASLISIERDANRNSISYACDSAVTEDWDEFHRRANVISQYYELLYPCDTDTVRTMLLEPIARHVIAELATDIQLLPSGTACQQEGTIRGVGVGGPSQFRHDVPCDRLSFHLADNSYSTPLCCQTVQMSVDVDTSNDADLSSIRDMLSHIINEPHADLPVQTIAINDPTLSLHRTSVSVEADDTGGDYHMMEDRGLTITGGLLVGFLLASIVSFVAVSFRRSRRRTTYHHRMLDFTKDETVVHDELNFMDSTVEPDSSDYSSQGACGIYHVPAHPHETPNGSFYSMAESLREAIFWREQCYPIDDEISEADSWAQTDATVGSLEERLEQITAEI